MLINTNTVNRRNLCKPYRFAGLFLLCSVIGCGSGLTDVTGTVTLDGKPVEGASLYFAMESTPSIYAIGTTDADGTYSLSTFRGGDRTFRGALPGDYLVTVVKKEDSGQSEEDVSKMTIEEQTNYRMSKAASGGKMRNKKFVYHIPQKYGLATTSGLKVTIPKDGSIVQDFPLTSEK